MAVYKINAKWIKSYRDPLSEWRIRGDDDEFREAVANKLYEAGFTDGSDASPEISLWEYGGLGHPEANEYVNIVQHEDDEDTFTLYYDAIDKDEVLDYLEGLDENDGFWDFIGQSKYEVIDSVRDTDLLSHIIESVNMYSGHFISDGRVFFSREELIDEVKSIIEAHAAESGGVESNIKQSFRASRLIGYYNEYGYFIMDLNTNEELYNAGNSPFDSTSILPMDKGVGLDAVKEFCESTGKEMADELSGKFLGCEYVEPSSELKNKESSSSTKVAYRAGVPEVGDTVIFARDADALRALHIEDVDEIVGTPGVVYDEYGDTLIVRDKMFNLWEIPKDSWYLYISQEYLASQAIASGPDPQTVINMLLGESGFPFVRTAEYLYVGDEGQSHENLEVERNISYPWYAHGRISTTGKYLAFWYPEVYSEDNSDIVEVVLELREREHIKDDTKFYFAMDMENSGKTWQELQGLEVE